MSYNNKIEQFYPNKFIIGDAKYDRKNNTTKEPSIQSNSSFDSDDLNVPYNYNEIYDFLVESLEAKREKPIILRRTFFWSTIDHQSVTGNLVKELSAERIEFFNGIKEKEKKRKEKKEKII